MILKKRKIVFYVDINVMIDTIKYPDPRTALHRSSYRDAIAHKR